MSDFAYVMRRLLVAFSDASPAFEESRATVPASGGRPALRFLEAFSDTAPAFGTAGRAARETGTAGTGANPNPNAEAGAEADTGTDALAVERAEERGPTFWNRLEPAERRYVEETAHERLFGPGVPLLRQGYPADYVVVIRSGWAKVRVDRVGVERIVAVRGPGDLVGERALWRVPWSATVVALGAVRALVMTADEFAEVVTRFPRMLSILEEQVRERRLAEQPVVGARQEVIDTEQRLAALFTTLSGAQGRTLAVTDTELAGWVSSSPAMIGSVLTSWDRQGIVRPGTAVIDVLDPDRLERLTGGRETTEETADAAPFSGGGDCTIIFTDIAGFSDPARTETDRQLIRKVLDSLTEEAFDDAGVRWAACHIEDRGDGLLIVAPPGIAPGVVTGPLLERLGEELSRYNRQADETQRFKVRVAVHVGPVLADQDGVYGSALNLAARLLDAPPLRERVAGGSADLGLIMSDTAHRTAAGRSAGAGYRRVSVRAGDEEVTAWTRLLPH